MKVIERTFAANMERIIRIRTFVLGKVIDCKGKLEIVVTDPEEMKIDETSESVQILLGGYTITKRIKKNRKQDNSYS